MRASTINARACAIAGTLAILAACAGQTDNPSGGAPPVSTGGGTDSGTTGPGPGSDIDSSVDPGGEADGGPKTPKPKAIGSPCSADTDCASGLTCNATFPGGMCTKACTADADCAGKGGSIGACVTSLCFASCTLDADAGADPDGGDGGKPKAPCKNKAFECVTPPSGTGLACLPGAGDDGGTSVDAAPMDSAASD